MLKKLFGYECRAMGRILLPLYGAMVIMGLVSAFLIRSIPLTDGQPGGNMVINVIAVLIVVLFFFIVVAGIGGSEILSIYRFYKNLFTEEGYLMNTLPVNPWQNITAKLLASVLFQLLALVVTFLIGMVFLLISSSVPFGEIWQDITTLLPSLIQYDFDIGFWVIALELVFLVLVLLVSGIMQFYTAISIGCSANRHRLLKAVGIYVLFNIAISVIQPFIGISFEAVNTGLGAPLQMAPNLSIQLFLLGTIGFHLALCVLYFVLSCYFMRRRLNI